MYNRLFTKILDSSIWLEPDGTRIVWITLLASMDQDGYAHFSALENLAARARVSLAKAQRAIEILESEDANSENPTNNGKRIERIPGGWLVLNAISYRQKFSKEIEREQTRLRVAKHRAKGKDGNGKSVTKTLQSVSPASASVLIEELKKDSTYNGIDVAREFGKMAQWCKTNGKTPTRRRFVNWLNRADKPLTGQYQKPKEAAPSYPGLPPKREISAEDREKAKQIAQSEVSKLRQQFRMP